MTSAQHFQPTSRIEISASAFENNLRFIRGKVGAETVVSAVVKGNAYGHSIEVFVPMAEKAGIRHFSVFSIEEAVEVKKYISVGTDIMIMGAVPDDALHWVVENHVEIFVFDMERLDAALNVSTELNIPARLHIEIETGMNRTGFDMAFLPKIKQKLDQFAGGWVLEGLCTHYAGAESSSNYLRVKNQIKKFNTAVRAAKKLGLEPKNYILRVLLLP